MSYTVEYKLKVVSWYHSNGENKHATARNFKIDRKRVRDWVEKEDQLKQLHGVDRKRRRLNSGRQAIWPELDEAVPLPLILR